MLPSLLCSIFFTFLACLRHLQILSRITRWFPPSKEQRNEGLKERKPKPNFGIEFRLRLSRSRIIEYGIRFRPNRISLSTQIFGRISALFNTLAKLFGFLCSWLFESGAFRFSSLKDIILCHFRWVSQGFTLLLGLNLVWVPFFLFCLFWSDFIKKYQKYVTYY